MVLGKSLVQSFLGLLLAKPRNLAELFGPSLSSNAQIILPNETQWKSQVQSRWSNYHAPTYRGAIKPATEADVQQIVKIAGSNKVPFLVTGAGHGISDYSRFNGIAVDLGKFDSVEIDRSENLLTVGGGSKYSSIIDILYDAGKELPLSSCPCVGIIGATMGAGIGPLVGHRGLMIDALQSVKIITAAGALVTASASENSDLFWAIRGAGANFGVITSAKYKVYDITNDGKATVINMMAFPASTNESFYEVLHTLDEIMPSRLGLTIWASYNHTLEQSLINLHAVYFGPEHEILPYLQPFQKLQPAASSVVLTPQRDLFPGGFGACIPNQHIVVYTLAVKQIHPQTFSSVFKRLGDFSAQFPDYEGRLLIQRFGKDAVAAIPHSSTLYPWRDAIAHVNIESFYSNTSNDVAVNEFARSARAQLVATSGYDSLATYSNFAHGDEGPEAWYGAENLPRLVKLKEKWDPKGLFSWHNPIKTHGDEL